jgi:hypothetical protein
MVTWQLSMVHAKFARNNRAMTQHTISAPGQQSRANDNPGSQYKVCQDMIEQQLPLLLSDPKSVYTCTTGVEQATICCKPT